MSGSFVGRGSDAAGTSAASRAKRDDADAIQEAIEADGVTEDVAAPPGGEVGGVREG